MDQAEWNMMSEFKADMIRLHRKRQSDQYSTEKDLAGASNKESSSELWSSPLRVLSKRSGRQNRQQHLSVSGI